MVSRKGKLSIALASVMSLGLVLSGCSSNSGNETSTASPAVSPAASAAATAKVEALKPVKLTWYIRNAEPKNAAAVMQKANEIISSKINATLEFKYINPGDYDNKMQLVMSSGEEFDIAFAASWIGNKYADNAIKGAYIPVDDLLNKYPDLKNMFKKEIWDGVKVNGKIYGVPNNQIMGDQPGMWFKKDLVDKYKIDLTKPKTMTDFTPLFQTIKDGEKDVIPERYGVMPFNEYVPAVEGGFNVDTKTWKVYSSPETLVNQYKTLREWNTKGFFPQDVATMKDELSLIKAGKVFSRYNRFKPGTDADLKNAYGFEVVTIPVGPSVISKGSVTSTLNAISTTSKNPERAMMLINLIDTNKDLFNLLKFGIEGQDYTKVSANRIEQKKDGYALPGWLFGNEFNSFVIPGQIDDVWDQTKKLNDSSLVDPLISFVFDRKPVENELAQLNAAAGEYGAILNNGLDDTDKTLKAYLDKRKAAGADKVMAELQKQIDAWRSTQK